MKGIPAKGNVEMIDTRSIHNKSGLMFHIIKGSFVDGYGIRTTIFLKGCPLRCIWCCNPEGQESYPEIKLSPAHCNGCGRCVQVCPADAIHQLKPGGVLEQVLREIEVECLPGDIPSSIDVDVSALEIGDSIHVADITLKKAKVLVDPEQTLVTVVPPTVYEEPVVEEEIAEEEIEGEEEEKKEEKEEAAEGEPESG